MASNRFEKGMKAFENKKRIFFLSVAAVAFYGTSKKAKKTLKQQCGIVLINGRSDQAGNSRLKFSFLHVTS
jgi:hypothetical protein